MRRKLRVTAVLAFLYAVFQWLWHALGAIGNVQTASSLAAHMPEIVQKLVQIVSWPLLGPLVCLACLFAIVMLDRRALSRESLANGWAVGGKQNPQPLGLSRDAKSTVEASERVVVNVTPEYLMEAFDGRTSIQAQKLVDVYLGKWIRVSGPLGDVHNTQVTFQFQPGVYKDIFMYFSDSRWIERLSVLSPGEKIVVVGRIDRVSRSCVELQDCELTGT